MEDNTINLPNITLHNRLTHGKYHLISNTEWKHLYEYIFETHGAKICFEKNIINYFRIANPFDLDDLYNSNYGSYTPIYINTYGIDRAIKAAIQCKSEGKQFYAVLLNIYVFNIFNPTQEDLVTINRTQKDLEEIYRGNIPPYLQRDLTYEDPAVNALVLFSSTYSNIYNKHKSLLGHTNLLLFDLITDKVERFESFGYKGDYLQLVDFDSKIEKALMKNNFTYLRPIEEYGLQKFLLDANEPYRELGTCTCTIWSVYYLDSRLLNSSIDRNILIKRLNTHFTRTYGKEAEKYMYETIYNYWNILKTFIEYRQGGLSAIETMEKLRSNRDNFYYKKSPTVDVINNKSKSIWSYFKL